MCVSLLSEEEEYPISIHPLKEEEVSYSVFKILLVWLEESEEEIFNNKLS